MTAEFTTRALIASEHAEELERKLEQLSEMTNDTLLLARITTAIDMVRDASGYIAFIASRSRAELHQQERQREELIKELQASIEARKCEVTSGSI